MRTLAFLLFFLLALPGSSENRVTIVWKGQASSPAIDALKTELKLRRLGLLLFVDGPADTPPEAAYVEDALAGRSRAIIFGAPTTAVSSQEEIVRARTPILLYDEASNSPGTVFVGFDRRKVDDLPGDAPMTEEEPVDRDSF